jgi:hypothetical protein
MPVWSSAIDLLSPAQIDSLRAFWYQACSEAEDADKYASFINEEKLPKLENLDLASFATLFESIDFYILRETALRFLAATQALDHRPQAQFTRQRPRLQSPNGLMIFGSRGDDVYIPTKQVRLSIVDPAGQDRYKFPSGQLPPPCFFLLDCRRRRLCHSGP